MLFVLASSVSAQDKWEKWGPTKGLKGSGVIVRAGYTIGGTTPLPLPAEIRSIEAFSPKGGATVGADAYKMINKRWGVSAGVHFFYEGFSTTAEVKNYKVKLENKEGNVMEGYFTGTNKTVTSMWGMTLPVLATFRISPRWNVSFGPYLSSYFKKEFDGCVYANKKGVGYLRQDTPTGPYVGMETPTDYPDVFADNMLSCSGGVELGFDWKALKHMNVFGKVDWGLSNIWDNDFDAIGFKMFPIYATVGLAYRY